MTSLLIWAGSSPWVAIPLAYAVCLPLVPWIAAYRVTCWMVGR